MNDPGRDLVRMRRRTPGVCIVCGATWSGAYSSKRYCSGRCRMRAHLERRRQQPFTPPRDISADVIDVIERMLNRPR